MPLLNNTDFLIAPSMLSCDFSQIAKELKALEQAGADWIHWDIMDSHFVPNLSFGPSLLKSVRGISPLFFDVHLMVQEPERFILPFQKAGADLITFHIEASSNPLAVIQKIKTLKLKAGMSLKPSTPVDSIFPFLKVLDLVLIMTVEPGAGGQSFLPKQAKKVGIVKQKAQNRNPKLLIEVDGGIQPETAKKLFKADVLVSGSYIFNSKNYSKSIQLLKKSKQKK